MNPLFTCSRRPALFGLLGIVILLSTGQSARAQGLTSTSSDMGELLPFIVGGVIAMVVVGAGFLIQISKNAFVPGRAVRDPNAVELPPDLVPTRNPLSKLAVPVALALTVGITGYLLYVKYQATAAEVSKPAAFNAAPQAIQGYDFKQFPTYTMPTYTPSPVVDHVPPPQIQTPRVYVPPPPHIYVPPPVRIR